MPPNVRLVPRYGTEGDKPHTPRQPYRVGLAGQPGTARKHPAVRHSLPLSTTPFAGCQSNRCAAWGGKIMGHSCTTGADYCRVVRMRVDGPGSWAGPAVGDSEGGRGLVKLGCYPDASANMWDPRAYRRACEVVRGDLDCDAGWGSAKGLRGENGRRGRVGMVPTRDSPDHCMFCCSPPRRRGAHRRRPRAASGGMASMLGAYVAAVTAVSVVNLSFLPTAVSLVLADARGGTWHRLRMRHYGMPLRDEG